MLTPLNIVNTNNDVNVKNDNNLNALTKNSLLSRDAFLKLFIEQLKNQDPLNPMKNYEVSAQLAQFSSLEQLYNLNKDFQKFIEVTKKATYFQGIGLIGKNVEYEGDKIYKSENDNDIKIKFKLSEDAVSVNLNIYDEKGNLIRTLKFDNLTKGENSVTWDGKDLKGDNVPEGIYNYEVIAYNFKGEPVDVTSFGSGKVTNIRYDDDKKEALFKVNGDEVEIDKIISISD